MYNLDVTNELSHWVDKKNSKTRNVSVEIITIICLPLNCFISFFFLSNYVNSRSTTPREVFVSLGI